MDDKELRSESVFAGSRRHYQDRASSVPEVTYFGQLHFPEENRRHEYSTSAAASADFLHSHGTRRKGKSWKDILKLKRKRAKLQSPPPTTERVGRESGVYHPTIGGYCIRVVVTEINPQAYYKTLEVTNRTTAFEVIVKLIQKYAVKDEDREPNEFYLMEVKEGQQGSYSRVLANTDQLYELQCKWAEEEDCYFALYRAQLPAIAEPEVEDKFEQPDINNFRAMIISPSQDSFFDSFPDPRDSLFPSFSPSAMPLPISTHSMTTPTSQTTHSYRDISSRVQVSKLIVSPSDGSSDFDLGTISPAPPPFPPPFPLKPIKNVKKYRTLSNPSIETIAESEGEGETMVFNNESRKLSDSELRQTQRQLMQQSVNIGMQGIMAKVISETKQNSTIRKRVHERNQTPPTQLLPVSDSMPPIHLQQDLTIRNLVCSPLAPTQVNDRKNIPDFIFTPGPDDGTSDSEVDFQGSESSEPMRSGGSMEKNFNFVGVLDFEGGVDETVSDCGEKESCQKIEEEGEQENEEELVKSETGDTPPKNEQRSESVGGLLNIVNEDEENGDGFEEEEEEEVVEGEEEKEDSSENDDGDDENEDDEEEDEVDGYHETEDGRNENSSSNSCLTHKGMLMSSSLAKPVPVQTYATTIIDPYCASTVTAKRGLEAKTTVHLKHSTTSQFKQSVKQHSDDALKPVRSEPNMDALVDAHQDCDKTGHLPSGPDEPAGVRAAHVPLRRSQTYSSVTRIKRPHSIHITRTPSDTAIDFTKDEIFRKAALRGMVKKPKPKEQQSSISSGSAGDKLVNFPVKDIVTDLDSITLDSITLSDKKSHRPFRRYSLLEIKSAGSQPYISWKDKKAVLDGSPPKLLAHQYRQRERPKSVNFSEVEQGSPRPNSAPAKFKKSQDERES